MNSRSRDYKVETTSNGGPREKQNTLTPSRSNSGTPTIHASTKVTAAVPGQSPRTNSEILPSSPMQYDSPAALENGTNSLIADSPSFMANVSSKRANPRISFDIPSPTQSADVQDLFSPSVVHPPPKSYFNAPPEDESPRRRPRAITSLPPAVSSPAEPSPPRPLLPKSPSSHSTKRHRHVSAVEPSRRKSKARMERPEDPLLYDFSLGMLEEKKPPNPELQAQLAAIQRRVQALGQKLPPLVDPAPSYSDRSDHSGRRSLSSMPSTSSAPYRAMEFPAGRLSPLSSLPSPTPAPTEGVTVHRKDSRLRKISDVFPGIRKRKDTEKTPDKLQRKSSQPEPDDAALEGILAFQAEERIRRIRENLSPSTIARTAVVKSQLGRRYDLVFTALAEGKRPPNLLQIVKWRRKVLEDRRLSWSRKAIEAAKENQKAREHAQLTSPLTSQNLLPARPFSPNRAVEDDPFFNPEEAEQLNWLHHLSALHKRTPSSTTGSKTLREWSITAQLMVDYSAAMQQSATRPPLAHNDRTGERVKSRSLVSPFSSPFSSFRRSSDNFIKDNRDVPPIDESGVVADGNMSSPRSSAEHTQNPTIRSGRSFRLSLGNLRESPLQSLGSLLAPPIPAALQNDVSPSTSLLQVGALMRRRKPGLGVEDGNMSGSPSDRSEANSDADRDGRTRSKTTLASGHIGSERSRSPSEDDRRSTKADSMPRVLSKQKWARFPRNDPIPEVAGQDVLAHHLSNHDDFTPGPGDAVLTPKGKLNVPSNPFAISSSSDMGSKDTEEERRKREEDEELREREAFHGRALLLDRLSAQNRRVHGTLQTMAMHVREFGFLQIPVGEALGMDFYQLSPDVLDALSPRNEEPVTTWQDAEDVRIRKQRRRNLINAFIIELSQPRGNPLEMFPDSRERDDVIAAVFASIHKLEKEWIDVSSEIEKLKDNQASVSAGMNDVQPYLSEVSLRVNTTYPELGRNADLARQLESQGKSVIPYLSKLPPWVREALGPLSQHVIELLLGIFRLLLYPLWQLLPHPSRIFLAFAGRVIFLIIKTLYIFTTRYWRAWEALGEWLAQFAVFRIPTLRLITAHKFMMRILRESWRLSLAFGLFSFCLWYLTPPAPTD